MTVLSVAAGSGKSLLTRSFAVIRRRSGLPVRMYKPVAATVKPMASAVGTLDVSMIMAALAIGASDARSVCDFIHADGQLKHVDGRPVATAGLVSEDGVDFAALPAEVLEMIASACRRRTASTEYLVCEGAGAVTDVSPEHDVSNGLLARRAGRPVVLVASARRGGSLAALAGTQRVVPSEVGRLVAGFVLNNTSSGEATDRLVQRIERETGWPCLAAVPQVPLYAHLPVQGAPEPAAATWEEELAIVADFVERQLCAALQANLKGRSPLPVAELDGWVRDDPYPTMRR
jgi:dethiobiotin synthetase